MPKIVFFSNYINHHQLPLCKEFVELTNNDFYFVSQKAISEKRISFGYKNISNDYPFVVKTYESKYELDHAYQLANEADFVLFGSSNTDYIEKRIKENKITFKYSERLFKFEKNKVGMLREFRRVYINHAKYRDKKLYMLCSGTYAAYDFNKYGAYKGKTYKWGYFPETKGYDISQLMKEKEDKVVNILWAGRLLDWKHPEEAIKVALKLKENGYSFKLRMVGNGELEDSIKKMITNHQLEDTVELLGSMSPEEVRKQMEKANIFLFTSDYSEGWGAVLNEAMNSGCACVASHAAGSSGFLIKNNKNGYIYESLNEEDFYQKVESLVKDKEKTREFGRNAYNTIKDTWNADIAAERFIKLNECLEKGLNTPYTEGPCSVAKPIKEKDMYSYLTK